jgi:hypothetical protein
VYDAAYLSTAVIYKHKMSMQLTTDCRVEKILAFYKRHLCRNSQVLELI